MGESRYSTMFSFAFHFDGQKFTITKTGSKSIASSSTTNGRGRGCGNTIKWSEMAPVPVPEDFRVHACVNTEDVGLMPNVCKRSFNQAFNSVKDSLGVIKKIRAD